MVSEAALKQARELIDLANNATDDPRRTRIDLVQVANYIARQARQDEALRKLVAELSGFLSGQSISDETLKIAAETGGGWPGWLEAIIPGPASYYHAALRLVGHGALRNAKLSNDFEARIRDVEGLTASAQRTMEAWDEGWAEALTLTAAKMAAKPAEFRNRLIAAAWDLRQLSTGDEVPTWSDFVDGPTGPSWPPLNLGVYPILGGMDDEERFDSDGWIGSAGGGAAIVTLTACAVGFGATGNDEAMAMCIIGVVVLILILAFLAA